MEGLSAPWRMEYIKKNGEVTPKSDCILCDLGRSGVGRDRLVLFCGRDCYIVLNAFPYTSGHLMVVPYHHAGTFSEQSQSTLSEMMYLLKHAEKILFDEYQPTGFNMGVNVGRTAGAGIPGHLHSHLLPRWDGDTNFMTSIHEVRVLPESLLMTYDRLFPAFSRVPQVGGCSQV